MNGVVDEHAQVGQKYDVKLERLEIRGEQQMAEHEKYVLEQGERTNYEHHFHEHHVDLTHAHVQTASQSQVDARVSLSCWTRDHQQVGLLRIVARRCCRLFRLLLHAPLLISQLLLFASQTRQFFLPVEIYSIFCQLNNSIIFEKKKIKSKTEPEKNQNDNIDDNHQTKSGHFSHGDLSIFEYFAVERQSELALAIKVEYLGEVASGSRIGVLYQAIFGLENEQIGRVQENACDSEEDAQSARVEPSSQRALETCELDESIESDENVESAAEKEARVEDGYFQVASEIGGELGVGEWQIASRVAYECDGENGSDNRAVDAARSQVRVQGLFLKEASGQDAIGDDVADQGQQCDGREQEQERGIVVAGRADLSQNRVEITFVVVFHLVQGWMSQVKRIDGKRRLDYYNS